MGRKFVIALLLAMPGVALAQSQPPAEQQAALNAPSSQVVAPRAAAPSSFRQKLEASRTRDPFQPGYDLTPSQRALPLRAPVLSGG